jgi:WD40 repeat protein
LAAGILVSMTALAQPKSAPHLVRLTPNPAQVIWNLERGVRERTLTGSSENVYALAFTPDGTTLAAEAAYRPSEEKCRGSM